MKHWQNSDTHHVLITSKRKCSQKFFFNITIYINLSEISITAREQYLSHSNTINRLDVTKSKTIQIAGIYVSRNVQELIFVFNS